MTIDITTDTIEPMAGGVSYRGDRIVYSPSAFGSCIKALAAARQGYDPVPVSDHMMKIFNSGHKAEDFCVKCMKTDGWKIRGQQETFILNMGKTESDLDIVFECHVDGISKYSTIPTEFCLEIKSQSEDKYASFSFDQELFQWRYRWQFSIYKLATKLPFMLVRQERLKVDKSQDQSDLEDYQLFGNRDYIYEDDFPEGYFIPYEEVKARVDMIEELASSEQLPECDYRMYPCPFDFLHDDGVMVPKVHGDPLPVLMTELDEIWDGYVVAKQEAQNAAARLEEWRGRVVDTMGNNMKARTSDGRVVSYYYGSHSKTDFDAMKRDGIDVDKYRTKSENTNPTIVMPKEDKA